MSAAQRTLKSSISCTGIGLHSGRPASMTLRPAGVNTGIVFSRADMAEPIREIPAAWDRVCDTTLCTVIGNEAGVTVGTVEHLMAALAGCGVDNALIEVDGPEVPIMDGSAEPFVFLLECAGTVSQGASRRAIRVLKPVSVEDGESRATLRPASAFAVSLEIDFPDSPIDRQHGSLTMVNGAFKSELARARTFGFLRDVEYLRDRGLALGGSLDNAIVIDQSGVLNPEGLRCEDEFVRHKMLDAVGDLYLAGAPLIGAFDGRRSGHALNNRLLTALFDDETAWCFDTVSTADVMGLGWRPEEALAETA